MPDLNFLLDTTNAEVWAREFAAMFLDDATKTATLDEHTAMTWFANAMAAQEMASNSSWIKRMDKLYAERNAIVIAFAKVSIARGDHVGWVADEREPDWPVLIIGTPEGQVSWHFKKGELPDWVPPYPGEWDGHDDAEKYRRLAALETY